MFISKNYKLLTMNSLLFGIAASAVLSVTSLIAVLLRVSPLESPTPALAAFFASVFLSVSSISTLALYGLWKVLPLHAWDTGKLLSVALRQGILLGLATVCSFIFLTLGLLSWWSLVLIFGVFVLVEIALNS